MTSPRETPPHAVVALSEEQTGTLLGVFAWVLGALDIMADRAEAVGEPGLVEMKESLTPRLESLLQTVSAARKRSPLTPIGQMEPTVEAAYGAVRQAFEAWIELTAFETAQAAMEAHPEDAEEAQAEGDDPS
jgi:hypothetical protein